MLNFTHIVRQELQPACGQNKYERGKTTALSLSLPGTQIFFVISRVMLPSAVLSYRL